MTVAHMNRNKVALLPFPDRYPLRRMFPFPFSVLSHADEGRKKTLVVRSLRASISPRT